MPVSIRCSIVIFLLSLVFAGGARAQTAPITITETVVVTATGKEEAVSTVGASITVISREEIEQRHALSLSDLLRTVPGVSAVRTGGVGNLTGVFVRGGEAKYNKVLIDGIPLNEPGGEYNFASLSPENIDHIEVLRGAHSALFGSDAMASVIQIFTKRPVAGRPQLNITLDGGNYNTGHIAGGIGAKTKAVEYSLSGSQLNTDNSEPNNANRTTTVSGMVSGQLSSGAMLKFMGRGETGRTGTPGTTAFQRADMDAHFRHTDRDFLGGWDQAFGSRVTQQASYAYAQTSYRSTNLQTDPPYTPTFGDLVGYPSTDFLYDSGTNVWRHHMEYRIDAVLGSNQTLTGAFAYDGERGVLTDYRSTAEPQRPSRNNTGTTVQYEATASRASLVAGIRFEDNGSFGFYAAPRVTASWLLNPGNDHVGSTRLRGSVGRGIKEPTFRQSYNPSPYDLGNPDLKPERSRGYDIALEQRAADNRVGIEATYFDNHFDDLISTGPFDPVTFYAQYFNIGETRASGLELVGDAIAGKGLKLRGAYTYLDGKVIESTSSSPIFAPGKQLYRRPRHSGSLDAMFTRDRVTLALGGLFVGSKVDTDFNFPTVTEDEAYSTWYASGEVRFARRTSGFVTGDNLANRDYMEPLGYPALGRTVRAGIRASF